MPRILDRVLRRTTVPDPYALSTYHGKLLDNATIAATKVAEAILGYQLTIIQGIGGAAASGGTHIEGRAIDVAPWDISRKDRALKDVGFIGWPRGYVPGLWGAHGHYVLVFESRSNARRIAAAALRQIGSFFRGRNGLKGDGPDVQGAYRPKPERVFTMKDYRATFATPPPKPTRTRVTRARNRLAEAQAKIDQAVALLDATPDARTAVHREITDLRRADRILEQSLKDLPPR
ncbi:hypothetical protein [Nocardioides sp. 503]|uniref:hypothetical protein n=1 Tax=Nocardioides sp. 503 TaxID=2508326 RepID=UPI00106FBBC6|nr:hypothetical protein [Nocardioides sp. 503]